MQTDVPMVSGRQRLRSAEAGSPEVNTRITHVLSDTQKKINLFYLTVVWRYAQTQECFCVTLVHLNYTI